MADKLLFFNGEGYPYNFEYDAAEDYYSGTLFFDENSSDTFKTMTLYVFEKVDPISFGGSMTMDEFSVFDYSGISFRNASYSGETITSISRVNAASTFYSKWIYGDKFDEKFPLGTFVIIQNPGIPSFSDQYYQVVGGKPGATMVCSSIRNSIFTGYTYVSGGTITARDMILFNDYNGTLCSEKFTEYSAYITAKQDTNPFKTSIVGSVYNDTVTEITCIASANTYHRTFDLSGVTGDSLSIEVTLYTERPRIYQGSATFAINGTSALVTLNRRLNSSINLDEGQQVIFETIDGKPIHMSNPIFTINDGILEDDIFLGYVSFYALENETASKIANFSKRSLSSQNYVKGTNDSRTAMSSKMKKYDYYIEFSGDTSELINDLKVGHHIVLSATTPVAGSTLHEDREFTVKAIIEFRDFRINYWTQKINNDDGWFKAVVDKAITNGNTVQKQVNDDAIWMYENFDQSLPPRTIIQVDQYVINESGNQYNIKRIFSEADIRDLECTCSTSILSAFTATVIGYTTSNVITLDQDIDTTYTHTIDLFNEKYGEYLSNYGIIAYYQSASTAQMVIESTWPYFHNQYFDARVSMNGVQLVSGATSSIKVLMLEVSDTLTNEDIFIYETGKTANNYHGGIWFNLVDNLTTNNGFTITINDNEYFTIFSGYTCVTLNKFVTDYNGIFNKIGLSVSTGCTSGKTLDEARINYWSAYISGDSALWLGAYNVALQRSATTAQEIYDQSTGRTSFETNTLFITGLYPDIRVHSIEAKVNEFSDYEILESEYNKFIVIDATSLNSSSLNFFAMELATGMIVDITGSNYISNNGEYNIIGLNEHSMDLSYQGPFFAETGYSYSVHTHQFLRKPRGTYGKDIWYNWRFGNPHTNDIFFYDFTGEHLEPYFGVESLRYVGSTPLWNTKDPCNQDNIYLITEPNKDEAYVADPTKQQTVWLGDDGNYCLKFKLPRYDSADNYDYVPEPMQVFLGFNSQNEGVSEAAVRMDQVEYVVLSGYTDQTYGPNFTFTSNGLLTIVNNEVNWDWHDKGFGSGQQITMDFVDQASTGTTIFENHATYTIEWVNRKRLQLSGVTGLQEFYSSAGTYLYQVRVQPKKVLRLRVYGETEIEDERFRVGIKNLGLELDFEDESIFKESDINEDGVDYILLNRKRKELLMVYPEIFNYVGSYKALINSINFFGYNDLQVYEYYRNINPFSPLYKKLHKVLIPDMFDNSVIGYNPQNYIKDKYNMYSVSGNTGRQYQKTNLFNLTYQITDHEGNNVTLYSLKEVQIKLARLKRWLKRNVIPLSANIIDITGVADGNCTKYHNFDVSNNILKSIASESSTRINFIYSLTQNMDTNYLVEVRFYVHSDIVPDSWTCKIQTFNKDLVTGRLIPQQYHKLLKTDLEDFSFNIDKINDQYMYIETVYYNERGVGMVFNRMTNTSTLRNYILVNNNFTVPRYDYLNIGTGELYYYFYDGGYLYTND